MLQYLEPLLNQRLLYGLTRISHQMTMYFYISILIFFLQDPFLILELLSPYPQIKIIVFQFFYRNPLFLFDSYHTIPMLASMQKYARLGNDRLMISRWFLPNFCKHDFGESLISWDLAHHSQWPE